MEPSPDVRIDTSGAGEIRQQKSTRTFERKTSQLDVGELNTHRCERIQKTHGLVTGAQGRGKFESRILSQCSVERFASIRDDEIGFACLRGARFQHGSHPRDGELAKQAHCFFVAGDPVQSSDLDPNGSHGFEPDSSTLLVLAECIHSIRGLLEERDAIEALRIEKLPEPTRRSVKIGVRARHGLKKLSRICLGIRRDEVGCQGNPSLTTFWVRGWEIPQQHLQAIVQPMIGRAARL